MQPVFAVTSTVTLFDVSRDRAGAAYQLLRHRFAQGMLQQGFAVFPAHIVKEERFAIAEELPHVLFLYLWKHTGLPVLIPHCPSPLLAIRVKLANDQRLCVVSAMLG